MGETREEIETRMRAWLQTREGRIEAIKGRAYSRRFGSGNSNYIRECADDEYELLGFLADAAAERDKLRGEVAALREALDDLREEAASAHHFATGGNITLMEDAFLRIESTIDDALAAAPDDAWGERDG